MKKILATLLALSLTFGSLALPATESGMLFERTSISASAERYKFGDFEYVILEDETEDETVKITEYMGQNEVLDIPSIINGKIVSSIGDRAFYDCDNLKSLTIPNSVTSIGDYAFSKCTSLKSITIPNSVTSIGSNTFSECKSLTNITIPNSVTNIDCWAFSNCKNLTSITLPNSITSISGGTFEDCTNLTSITIPDSVTRIDYAAFRNCKSLTSLTIPDSVTSLDVEAFSGCIGIVDITLSRNLNTICKYEFADLPNLTRVTLKEGIKEVEFGAFWNCKNLKQITIPMSIETIESEAFGRYGNNFHLDSRGNYADFKIYCYPGTAGERYAINYGFDYELLNPHVHSYIPSITKQPTCTEEGEKTFTCDCGDTYTETIPAKGHTEVIDKAIPATCTTDGKTEGSHCSVCGEVIKVQTVIKATGHKYDDGKITKQPTCTETGVKTYTCSECGATKTETIKANGHTEVIDKAVPATCTTDGKTEGSHCSVCGEVIKAQTVIKATGHNFGSWSTTKSATCTESGTQTRKCAACGKIETETIPAKGHTSSGWIIDKQPAVGVKGSKHKECTVCGKILEKAEIPALSATDISSASVKLSTTSYTYNGKAKKPTATVTLNGKTLKKNVDYTVKYSSNTAIGKAKVTITGKGNYKGTVSKTFKILPAKQTIAKLTAQKKGFALTWTKDKNVTGYQIQYDVKSDFKSAKSAYVKSNSTYKKTISGLKTKKTYYVRVRSYKTVGGVKYYGSWSSVKSVKTK